MENFKAIEFQQERDFSKKMNATFEFIRQNFKSLSKSLLFIAGPTILLGSFFISSFYGKIFSASQMAGNPEAAQNMLENFQTIGFWLEIAGIALFTFLAGVFTISVVNNYMLAYEAKKSSSIEVSEIWDRVRQTLPMYVVTMILYVLALIVTYVVALVPMFLFTTISPVLAFFGVLILICVIIYIWVNLTLLFFIRAYEKKGFIESVSRCFYLIRDKWWSTFGLLFVTSLIGGTVASLFFIPWYINMIVTMLHSVQTNTFEEPSTISQLINNVFLLLYFLASFLLQALPLIALIFQYFNLVERKEAKGLLSRIQTIGQAPNSGNPSDEKY